LKLKADQKLEPGFAYRLSMRQIFGELMPAEKAGLREAARQEADRRKREAAKTGDQTLEQPVSAEKLFLDVMAKLVKEPKRE